MPYRSCAGPLFNFPTDSLGVQSREILVFEKLLLAEIEFFHLFIFQEVSVLFMDGFFNPFMHNVVKWPNIL